MTDTSSLATTQSTANVLPVTASPIDSPVPNGIASQSQSAQDEEEPYTIKCICAFVDDDGSTVFCERCETWQHILCYYHGQEVPDVHNCVDCEPRTLDGKRATERQRRHREQGDAGDRKGRRSGSKAQKKKTGKDTDSNGWVSHERSGSNSTARDHPPPAKKAKTGHRQSASVSSATAGAPLLPHPENSRKRATSASTSASPTKSSSLLPQIPLYSQEFLHLYDNDQANVDMQSSLFDTIGFTGDLASWVQSPAALARVSNGRTVQDVFTILDHPLDSTKWPVISRQSKTDNSIDIDGLHPTWQFVKVESDVRKDDIVGEVKGKIGHLHNYCLDPNSRWQELRHPEPFVFFHPQLPVYIDSRKEGTQMRYIRRSCQPNVTMRTFITNEVEYHFCFVANQDIPAQSEITATWYLDAQLFPSNNGVMKPDGTNFTIPDSAAVLISKVLANFGGCACNSQGCLLAKLDLRRAPKNTDSSTKQLNGKRRKSKKQVPSPIGTGRATNSRAGSEATPAKDDDEHAGSRSSSASLRDNNPRSRDLTPSPNNPNPNPSSSTTTELSAREKRKIAAAEKNFERLEQDQHVQKRRKKSSGTSLAANNPPRLDTAHSRRSSGSPMKQSPKSATSRRGSHSSSTRKVSGPNTPNVGSPLAVNSRYVDREMQTEPDENDPRFVPPQTATAGMRRHIFVPLTQRLLRRCHEDRLKLTGAKRFAPPSSMAVGESAPQQIREGQDQDVEMRDADTSMTPTKTQQSPTSVRSAETVSPTDHKPFKTPPHPWPSSLAHHIPLTSPSSHRNGIRPGGIGPLRVQLPPNPISNISPPSTSTPSVSQSPFILKSSASQLGSNLPQTPGSSITAPSPVKKKLSLGDYMSRRGTLATPTMEKPPSLVPSQTSTSPPGQGQAHNVAGAGAGAGSPEPTSQQQKGTGEGEMKRESATPQQEDVSTQDEAPYSPPNEVSPAPAPNAGAGQQPPPSTMSRDPRLQHR